MFLHIPPARSVSKEDGDTCMVGRGGGGGKKLQPRSNLAAKLDPKRGKRPDC